MIFKYINMEDRFNQFISSSDALFHYTKNNIALEHILYDGEIKFSSLYNANDPHEFNRWSFSGSCWGDISFDLDKLSHELGDKLNETIKHNTGIISFCQNKYDNNKLYSLGCLKERMWAQYGDNNYGLCIVLSKEMLKKQLDDIFPEKNYCFPVNYDDKLSKKAFHIDYNEVEKIGVKEYISLHINNNLKEFFFSKSSGFQDEDEYRSVLFNDELSTNNKIPIKNCIKGIILGNRHHSIYKSIIKELVEKYKIEFRSIHYENGEYFLFQTESMQ